jgi:hypothetical protein
MKLLMEAIEGSTFVGGITDYTREAAEMGFGVLGSC